MITKMLTLLKKVFHILTKHEKKQFSIFVFLAILMSIFQSLSLLSILKLIAYALDLSSIYSDMLFVIYLKISKTPDNMLFFLYFGLFVIILVILSSLLSILVTWKKAKLIWSVNHSISQNLIVNFALKPFDYFLNTNSTDIGTNILSEVSFFTKGLLTQVFTLLTQSFIILFIFLSMLFVNISITIITFFFIILMYFIVIAKFYKKIQIYGARRNLANLGRFRYTNDLFSGIKDVKIFGCENYFLNRFKKNSVIFSNTQSWIELVGALPKYLIETVSLLAVISLLLYASFINSNMNSLLPLMSFFFMALFRIIPSIQTLYSSFTQIQFQRPVLENIYSNIAYEVNKKNIEFIENDPLNACSSYCFGKTIELCNINFSYKNSSKKILKNINIVIKKDTSVAFIGKTGSGKTTIADIILGLLKPSSGKILIDGNELLDKDICSWRKNIGYIPQNIFLTDDTIANNIAFGVEKNELDQFLIEKATRIANLHDFIISSLPDSYNTFIGERGIRLSGGQRQRIGIARALYHDPQILLFDEATNSLDSKTENDVMSAINEISKIKTIIIIAHRLSTIENCDKIFLLDNGEIVSSGKYNELIHSREFIKLFDSR